MYYTAENFREIKLGNKLGNKAKAKLKHKNEKQLPVDVSTDHAIHIH